jgi:hypothetical protein
MKENYKNKKTHHTIFSGSFRRNDGFTLVEMMVIILVLALIIVFTFTAFNISNNKTRDAVIISELEQLRGIAETVYHPEVGYKELYEMRENGYPTVENIRKRITEVGRIFKLFFPKDSIYSPEEYDKYCAYSLLFSDPNTVFCIDSSGFVGKIEISPENQINCQIEDFSPYDCQYE